MDLQGGCNASSFQFLTCFLSCNVFPEAMCGRLDGQVQIVVISWSQVSGNILAMLIQSEIYFFNFPNLYHNESV